MSTTKTRTTTRKVVGSLAVLGTAAAVAGLGTFGTFTDSTAPINTTVTSGTVDINLAQPGVAVPATISGFLPGDSMSRPVTLSNNGDSALASVTLDVTSSTNTVLTSDAAKGLQLLVKSCTVAWSQNGPDTAPTYGCTGTEGVVLATNPVLGSDTFTGLNSLTPAKSDNLLLTVSLPTTADNAFQGKSAALSLVFTGTQRNGTAR
jgi:hypothetical protein